jgi:hypothetical protein
MALTWMVLWAGCVVLAVGVVALGRGARRRATQKLGTAWGRVLFGVFVMIETVSRLAGTSPGLGPILSGLALIPLAAGILLLLRPHGALAAPPAGTRPAARSGYDG